MALILHPSSTSSFATKKTHLLRHSPPLYFPSQAKPRILAVKSEGSSSSSNSLESQKSATISSSSTEAPPPKKPNSASGLGFGSSTNATGATPLASKKKQKGNKERATIIRRAPVEKPRFASQKEDIRAKEQSQAESAFLLTWLGLGAIILVQGIGLAASGI